MFSRIGTMSLAALLSAGCGERMQGPTRPAAIQIEQAIPRIQAGASEMLAAASPVGLRHFEAGRIDHLSRAQDLQAQGDLAGALVEARRAAADDQDDLSALEMVANLARAQGDREVEIDALVELSRRKSDAVKPLLRAARLMLEEGDARGALFEATLAIAREPEEAEGYQLRGRAELMQGELAEAALDFESAVILDPRHSYAFNNLGYALSVLNQPEPAALSYREALVFEPDQARPPPRVRSRHGRAVSPALAQCTAKNPPST